MSPSATGALLGLVAAAGGLLALSGLPALRRPDLDARVAPYLRDSPRPSRLLARSGPTTPLSTFQRLVQPVLAEWSSVLTRMLGGSATLRSRLERAGDPRGVEEFRVEQVLWSAVGLLVGLALSVVLLAHGAAGSAVPLVGLWLVGAAAGLLLRDAALGRAAARREARIEAELPAVAEMLALAVTAGEGVVGAMERVCARSNGDLADELRRVLAAVRAGEPLVHALDDLARRTSLPSLARFVDGVVVAVERGTPLADVLRALAGDVREAGKRALLEAGGRKEIAMMVPVVFLVLPVAVVFALFPGFYGFSVGSP